MRLAVIGDEISQELSEVATLARRRGFDGVEIRSMWNKPPLDLTRGDCLRIRAELDASCLQVAGFASPAFKMPVPISRAEVDVARTTLLRSLEIASWLAAPLLRVFSFMRTRDPDPMAAADAVGSILDGLGPVPIALAVETGTRSHTPSGPLAARFLARLDRPDIGLVWDPGNGVFSGFDRTPFPGSYRLIARHVRHVHVKDPRGGECYVPLGTGDLPWCAIVEALRANAFGGFLSLETHWRSERTLTAEQRDHPVGRAFSDGGYDASDQSMIALSQMARHQLGAS